MKIIKRNPKPWVGIPITCEECGSSFELEDGDTAPTKDWYREYRTRCPICSTLTKVFKHENY